MPRRPRINRDRLDALLAAGVDIPRAAEILDCQPNTLYRLTREARISQRRIPVDWDTHTPTLLHMWSAGATVNEITAAIGCARGAVCQRLTTLNLWGRKKAEVVVDFAAPSPPSPPPSIHMVRLAEFDPVIARALRERLGIQKEGEE